MNFNEVQVDNEITQEVMQRFFVPLAPDTFFAELDSAIGKLAEEFHPIGLAFRHNLQSVISTVGIPVTLAMASAQHARFQQLHIAEKIRARAHLGPDGEPTAEALQGAYEIAHKRMTEELGSRDGIDHLANTASSFLLGVYQEESTRQAVAELLLEGVVLVWGAFEVVARDSFVAYLNTNPHCTQRISSDSSTKRLFEIRGLNLDILAQYDFDVSRQMGNILVSLNDVSSLTAIKDVFQVLFPNNVKLRDALNAKTLWILAQRRHLIVHQRGIVDERYLRNSGDDNAVPGNKLCISPQDVEKYVLLVRDAGVELLNSLQ